MISDLDQKNQNTTHIKAVYAEAQNNWRQKRHLYDEAKPRLEKIIDVLEHWDEIKDKFMQARTCIETLEQEGKTRDAMISKVS